MLLLTEEVRELAKAIRENTTDMKKLEISAKLC